MALLMVAISFAIVVIRDAQGERADILGFWKGVGYGVDTGVMERGRGKDGGEIMRRMWD